MPKAESDSWTLETVHKFQHPNYFTHSILAELTSNGLYAFVPSAFGTIFVFDLKTFEMRDMICEPDLEWDYEVLDIAFHPKKALLISGGDDGTIRVISKYFSFSIFRVFLK